MASSWPDPDAGAPPPDPWASDPDDWNGGPAHDALGTPTLHALLGATTWPQLDAAPLYWMWLARFEREHDTSS
jgi:hypothetical protein